MITKIMINGFKSFSNFEMFFTPMTVVAGPNASGKSNLFDALQLLSRLAVSDLKTAFSEQRGTAEELFTQYGENGYAHEMTFIVEMLVNRNVKDNWGGEAELNNTRLRYKLTIERKPNKHHIDDLFVTHESLEKIKPDEDDWVKNSLPKNARSLSTTRKGGGANKPFIQTKRQNEVTTIKIRQDGKRGGKETPANTVAGTVLSSINTVEFPHAFAAKEEMKGWVFLQLNPEYLREPTKQEIGIRDTMTSGGKNLAATLYRIKQSDPYSLKEISRKLSDFLPNFTDVDVLDDKANKQFTVKVKDGNGGEFTSRVLSEGTLRLLALCVLWSDDKHNSLLCYEEPENGIHPFRMKAMVQLLNDLSSDFSDPETPLRQVIVNTHSPVLIKEIYPLINKNKDNKTNFISIWFSRLNTLITDIDGKRVILKISKVVPVNYSFQMLLPFFTESEGKLTTMDVIDYLNTADPESVIMAIHG